MPRLTGLRITAALLIVACCADAPRAAPALGAAADTQKTSTTKATTVATVPAAAAKDAVVADATVADGLAPESHLLDTPDTEPAAMDPIPASAGAPAAPSVLAPGRPRRPLVRPATGANAQAFVPLGSEIPDGPVAAANAPHLSCGDTRPTACTLDYKPVCADVDTGVRCITTPCPSSERKTFGSACRACRDPKVASYVSGTCPKD
jgi:hypothetical protein